MSKTIYDIFISYRRDGGGETAGRIFDSLTRDGYSVSYDVDTLREGRFDQQLLERIEQCQDFILVVDKNCFARTIDPATDPQDDWLWQELSYALRLKKNVIPVLQAGAKFPKKLPKDIDNVRFSNGPTYSHEYFDEFYKKLRDIFLRAYPRNAKPLYANPTATASKLPNLKIKADIDCVFYLDGEERSRLKAGIIQKIPLAKGEYELMFVSVESENDRLELEFEMPDVDKLEKVNLSGIRDSRLQKEAEAKRIAEEKRQEEYRRQEAERKAAEERKQEEERKCREEEERKRREEEERRRREAEERKRREEEARAKERVFKVGGVEFKMIRVEGGSFMMGSPDSDSDAYEREKPQHRVTLSDYYIGETQVTQALWKAVMGKNLSCYKGANNPVDMVSWEDCQEFIKKLNQQTGLTFTLPTEAQWEYAARGGNKSKGYKYAGSNNIEDVAWYGDNSGGKSHPVKQKKANELGLYDMSGNVWEWCQDRYGNYNSSAQTNATGPVTGSGRMLRGGCWGSGAGICCVAYRINRRPVHRYISYGFRLSLVHL